MKKRTMTVVLATCMCLSVLTACGNKAVEAPDTQKTETKTETTDETKTETTKKSKPFGDISYVTKAPTCTEEGVRTFHGKDGNYTKPEPPTGHKFYNVPDEKGNTIDRRCEYCNAQDPDWSPEESTQNQ